MAGKEWVEGEARLLSYISRAYAPSPFSVRDVAGHILGGPPTAYRICRRLVADGRLIPHYGKGGKRVTRYSLPPEPMRDLLAGVATTDTTTSYDVYTWMDAGAASGGAPIILSRVRDMAYPLLPKPHITEKPTRPAPPPMIEARLWRWAAGRWRWLLWQLGWSS